MPSCTVTPKHSPATKAEKITACLLTELQKAEHIIVAMLNAMTPAQKIKVHAQLDAADISGEGMTRYHERRAAIAAAVAAPVPEFTPDEILVAMAYRAMDGRAKQETLVSSLRIAKDHPSRSAPTFRLIVGGAA
ncbi:propanediol dehydratase large subunit [Oxalobacteraceae bacterium GrIS 1.11]